MAGGVTEGDSSRVLISKSLRSGDSWCQEGQTRAIAGGRGGWTVRCAERGSSRGRRLLGGGQQVDQRMTTLLGGWRGRCGSESR